MNVAVRRMRWWHIEAVLPLERELFTEDTWSERIFWSELAQVDTRHYSVAVDGEDVVGYGGVCVYPDEAHVLTLGVSASRQREGIGAALLEDLIASADKRGVARVLLEVRAGNESAQRLYARYGFAPIGVRRKYYQPSGTDAVVMRRDG